MPDASNINLFKNKNNVPEYVGPLQAQVRNLSILILLAVIIASGITIFLYIGVKARNSYLAGQKTQLENRLQMQKKKESMYIAIKSRSQIVDKVVESTKKVTQVIDLVNSIVNYPKINGVSYDESNLINLSIKADGIEDAIVIAAKIIQSETDKKLKNPMLGSISIGKDGSANMSVNFIPIWN
jgi:hypothetical protein